MACRPPPPTTTPPSTNAKAHLHGFYFQIKCMQTPTSTPEEFGQVWQTALYQRLCFKSNLLIHVGVQKASSSSPGLSCTIGMSLLRASASSPMIAFRSTPGSNQMPPVSTAASPPVYTDVQQICLQQQDSTRYYTKGGNRLGQQRLQQSLLQQVTDSTFTYNRLTSCSSLPASPPPTGATHTLTC